MWLVYFDESKQDNRFHVYCALIVESERWNEAFGAVKAFRKELRADYGIFLSKELHAWKFAAGKGQISDRVILKKERALIFRRTLHFVAKCGFFRVIGSVNTDEFRAFDRIMNRINRTAQAEDTNLILLCDEGQETQFTKRIRRMRVFNPIPSNRGVWDDSGSATRNIPTDRIIEDPVFKKSDQSYFIQLVDFCAYALMRMERPIPSRSVLGYDNMYPILRPAIVLACNRKDSRGLGIIR